MSFFTKSSETNVADANGGRQWITDYDWTKSEDCLWSKYEWRTGKDGKTRRVKPGIRLLAHGISRRVDLLHIGGNAIVPSLAEEFIKAYIESREGELSV